MNTIAKQFYKRLGPLGILSLCMVAIAATLYFALVVPLRLHNNLLDRQLEVHRDPAARPATDAHHYLSLTIVTETETASPAVAPESAILISDLLPRRV